ELLSRDGRDHAESKNAGQRAPQELGSDGSAHDASPSPIHSRTRGLHFVCSSGFSRLKPELRTIAHSPCRVIVVINLPISARYILNLHQTRKKAGGGRCSDPTSSSTQRTFPNSRGWPTPSPLIWPSKIKRHCSCYTWLKPSARKMSRLARRHRRL